MKNAYLIQLTINKTFQGLERFAIFYGYAVNASMRLIAQS